MKFKKFKARKSNKRNGIKKAVNVALIIKIAVSALALLTVLGVVGSMFSGSSSGSSSGGSTVRPSRPGTSAPNTEQTEQTEETDVPEVTSNYRLNFDYVRTTTNLEVVPTSAFDNVSPTFDLSYLDDVRGLILYGWFMTESGVSEYRYEVHDRSGEAADSVITFEGLDKNDDQNFIYTATIHGFDTDALLGCRFHFSNIDLTSYSGKTVDVYFYALTNNGRDILLSTFNNIMVE